MAKAKFNWPISTDRSEVEWPRVTIAMMHRMNDFYAAHCTEAPFGVKERK